MKQKISQMMIKKYRDHQYVLPEYNPAADFDWIRLKSGLPWLLLGIDVPHVNILDEIKNIEPLLIEHREEYGEHCGWKSFCIHGKSYNATREDQYYNDERPYTWTPEAMALMPNTVNYFKTVWPASKFFRIRVMLLEPGGYISIHNDYNEPRLSPINIAITQPDDCNFVMERKGSVPFTGGDAFWLDISNNHAVFNTSNDPRWHIIVHQTMDSQKFQEEVVKSYNRMYNSYNENSHNRNQRRS
jgi:hypothetical protein